MDIRLSEHALLAELLLELADDDFVVSLRAAEWLGLAPHLEEDVAFASIAQDEMGHANAYYGLLADLGFGTADDLAHLRPAAERRNSRLVERPNGRGSYLDASHYDWAYALMRHFLYDTLEMLRLERLAASSYQPLAEVARKIRREERYHLMHHEMWLNTLAWGGHDPAERVAAGLARAALDAGDLAYTTPWAAAWEDLGLFPGASNLTAEWSARVEEGLKPLGLELPRVTSSLNGRLGQHDQDLTELLEHVSEVYRAIPGAAW